MKASKPLMTRRGWIALGVFLVLLMVSGFALKVSGNWENPLEPLGIGATGFPGERFSREQNSGSTEAFSAPQGFTPPESGSNSSEGARPQFREGERGGREGDAINWSQFGQVLYDVWVLFAAAGVVIVIGLIYRVVRERIRPQGGQTVTV